MLSDIMPSLIELSIALLSVVYFDSHNAECHYVVCHCFASVIRLKVIMLSVSKLSAMTPLKQFYYMQNHISWTCLLNPRACIIKLITAPFTPFRCSTLG